MSYLELVASETSPESSAFVEAIEQLDTGMCVFDRDGSVLANNQAFRRLLDLPPDWVNPKAVKRPVPASEELVTGWLARVASEGNFAETVALSARFIVHIAGKALPSGGISLTLTEAADEFAPNTDRTKQVVAQWVLHEAEENFRGVVENMADVYYHADLQGKTIFGGPAIGRLLGYGPEEFDVLDWRAVHVDPDRRAKILDELDRNGGQVRDFEAAYRHKNGGTVWLSSNARYRYGEDGEPVGLEGVLRNITAQKKAQEALRESENSYRTLLDYSPESISLKDAEGRFLIVNKACEVVLGQSADEMLGRTIWEVLPGGDWHDSDASDTKVLNGEVKVYNDELSIDVSGRGRRIFRRTKFPVLNGDARPIGVGTITTDVTEQIAARERLRRSEAGLRHAQKLVHIGNWEKNFITGEVYWSDEVFEILGIEKQPIPQFEKILEYIHPDDRQTLRDKLDAIFAGVAHHDVEFRVVTPAGEVRYAHELSEVEFDDSGQPVRCVGVIQDITAAKLAEAALRESEQRFRSIIDNLPSSVSLKDRDHRFVLVNKSFETLYGRAEKSVIGEPLLSAMPDHNDWESIIAADQEILDGERATYEDLITLRFNGGAIRSFEMRKFPVTDADGNITSVGTISTDITGRVVAEQALRESEAKFHAIFAEAGLGMALVDKDGVFFDVNPALARMFGMSCDELVGKDIRTLTAPEDIDRSIESFDDLVSGETDVRKL